MFMSEGCDVSGGRWRYCRIVWVFRNLNDHLRFTPPSASGLILHWFQICHPDFNLLTWARPPTCAAPVALNPHHYSHKAPPTLMDMKLIFPPPPPDTPGSWRGQRSRWLGSVLSSLFALGGDAVTTARATSSFLTYLRRGINGAVRSASFTITRRLQHDCLNRVSWTFPGILHSAGGRWGLGVCRVKAPYRSCDTHFNPLNAMWISK